MQPEGPTPRSSIAEPPTTDRDDQTSQRALYAREVLELYLVTPGVAGRVRRADHQLAAMLFDQNVPIYAVQYALIVAAFRRIRHNGFSTPMPPIRSLHYFRGVIHEMLDRPPGYRELAEMQEALRRET